MWLSLCLSSRLICILLIIDLIQYLIPCLILCLILYLTHDLITDVILRVAVVPDTSRTVLYIRSVVSARLIFKFQVTPPVDGDLPAVVHYFFILG